MRVILTDKDLNAELFPSGVQVKKVDCNHLKNFEGDGNIVAIAGSRAMAIHASQLNFPGLKFFQLTSAGFDGVPNVEYREKNIAVANAGNVYSIPIAETVVFGILYYAKRLRNNPNNRHAKLTRGYKYITEIAEKKVLILGAGNIGTAVAERLLGFDCVIDGYDPYCCNKEQYGCIYRCREELLKNINQYDYIVSTLPDNKDTRGFIDKELFVNMKNSAVIVNVGRKAVFNESDFYNALKRHSIGGAVLDMFEKIPNPIQNKFRRLPNVIVFPGVAAISKEVDIRLRKYMTENLLALLNGKEIKNIINGVR